MVIARCWWAGSNPRCRAPPPWAIGTPTGAASPTARQPGWPAGLDGAISRQPDPAESDHGERRPAGGLALNPLPSNGFESGARRGSEASRSPALIICAACGREVQEVPRSARLSYPRPTSSASRPHPPSVKGPLRSGPGRAGPPSSGALAQPLTPGPLGAVWAADRAGLARPQQQRRRRWWSRWVEAVPGSGMAPGRSRRW
jgi:hypothetical protein